MKVSHWLNPSLEQEQSWHDQRLVALNTRRQAVGDVLRLRDVEARRRFLTAYGEKWGVNAAASLELSVRAEWDKWRQNNNVSGG